MFKGYGIVKVIILYSDKDRILEFHSLSLWVSFAHWEESTEKSLVCQFLCHESQFWNVRHLKLETKMPKSIKKHADFWRTTQEYPRGFQKRNKSMTIFSSLILCSANQYSLNHQGVFEFWPCHYLCKGNIINPRELLSSLTNSRSTRGNVVIG